MSYYKILYDLVMRLYMILFIIIQNNISFNLLITLIYYFISTSLFSNILNHIYLLLKIGFLILYY